MQIEQDEMRVHAANNSAEKRTLLLISGFNKFLLHQISSQAGWGCEQPGLEGGIPAYSGGLELDDLKGLFQPRPPYDSMISSARADDMTWRGDK